MFIIFCRTVICRLFLSKKKKDSYILQINASRGTLEKPSSSSVFDCQSKRKFVFFNRKIKVPNEDKVDVKWWWKIVSLSDKRFYSKFNYDQTHWNVFGDSNSKWHLENNDGKNWKNNQKQTELKRMKERNEFVCSFKC